MISRYHRSHPNFVRIIITVQIHRSSEQCGWIGWFSQTCKIDDTRAEFNGQSIPSGFDPMMIAIALLPVAKLVVTYFNVSDVLPSGNLSLTGRAWTATSSNFGEQGYRHPILRDGVNILVAPYNELSFTIQFHVWPLMKWLKSPRGWRSEHQWFQSTWIFRNSCWLQWSKGNREKLHLVRRMESGNIKRARGIERYYDWVRGKSSKG